MNHLFNIFETRKSRPARSKAALAARWLAIAALTCGVFPLRMARAMPPAGPAVQTFDLTLDEGTRTEMAGPLYYRQQLGTEVTQAWPPFYSRCTDPAVESREDDFLYPLLTYGRHGREYRWQLLQVFSIAGGANPTGGEAKRFTIYPLYFRQRSANTNDNYTAILPFYGHIKNRLMLNDVSFVMFPLYSESRKKGVVTDNYLYPFFHLRHGDHLEGWQLWPLLGAEHKDITSATNGFGDVSLVPGHDESFALWPVYYHNQEGVGTANPETSLGVIPLYAGLRSPQRDSTTVIWPFFSWIDDREKHYHEWQGPWPLVIFTRGEGKHTDRVWPLFSRSRDARQESDSWLWPLYQYRGYHVDPLQSDRTRVLFYLYENTVQKNTLTGAQTRRVDMWPFFTWHQDAQGSRRLQILAPVEPALPDQPGLERNWSPLWSLWRAEDNATNGCQSRSLLWNLYRRETRPAAKKCSLLFGLFQYRRQGETNQLRCFYGPVFDWRRPVKSFEK